MTARDDPRDVVARAITAAWRENTPLAYADAALDMIAAHPDALIDLLVERGALEHMSNVPSRNGTRRLFVDMTQGGASDEG